MAKNHVGGATKQMKFTATAAMTSGLPHVEADTIVVPADTYAIGDDAVGWLNGAWRLACPTGEDIAAGDDLYWDVADGEATLDDDTGTNRFLGKAANAAGVGAVVVEVELIQSEAP